MSDRVFYKNLGPYKLSEIAQKIGCEFVGSDILIKAVKSLSEASSSDISFFNNKKYLEEFKNSKVGACLVPLDFDEESDAILLKVKNPYYTYALVLDMFYADDKKYEGKIMPTAYVSGSAKIGKNCYIGHNVVIEDGAEIGDDSIIESGSVIDYKVKIGKRARIDANVTISHAIIGDDIVILSGARIGQDGFGFATEKGIHKKIYHTGRVIIGNDVEIGANSCIDRGSMKDTIIGDLCRIDNCVQLGHNVHVKKGTVLVSQVGIAGSTEIGEYCVFGGQVGVAGHLKITNGVHVAGKSGIIKDVNEPGIIGGIPAMPITDWHKQTIAIRKLIKR
jgi:UDP-3-O-[3-hydroxymyristoyl] glucosamine N-acyltransferase